MVAHLRESHRREHWQQPMADAEAWWGETAGSPPWADGGKAIAFLPMGRNKNDGSE